MVPSTEEGEKGMRLVRIEIPWLDYDSNVEGKEALLAKEVVEFNLEYYDERKGEWTSSWDTEKIDWKGRLPRAVRVKIVFNNPDGENDEPIAFTSAELLPLYKNTVEY